MKLKKAFTMAELLIAMAIIGIISAIAVFTVQGYDKGIRFLYSNTYHNLDRALYNGISQSNLPNPFVAEDVDSNGQPITVTPQDGAERLCKMLAKYINGTSSCSSSNLAQEDGINFGTVKISSNNGVNIYISKRLPDANNPLLATLPAGEYPKFFLVYADLNGDQEPNSMKYEPASATNNHKYTDPDIFAFAAIHTGTMGRMCPLGPPEVDPRYMLTRVAYSSILGDDDQEASSEDAAITQFSKKSQPYYISKAEAWGYYLSGDPVADRRVIDEEPASYNGYIRYLLPTDTKIYSFLNGVATIPLPPNANIGLRSNTPENGGYGCREFSGEECWVIVDKYLY